VLDARLKDNEYLVGNKYSIADIANFSWVNVSAFAGLHLEEFPNLHRWWKKISERPAVKRGLAVPSPPGITNEPFQEKLKSDPEFKAKHEELQEILKKSKEQYDYKYASP
jgi:glutathione S-transferase